MIGTPINSACEIARWVASRSTNSGRDFRVIVGWGLAFALEAVGHELDLVVAFRMDRHQRAVLARDAEHLEQLPVGQNQIVVGHEHLERRVARADQGRKLLPQHRRRRIGDDEVKAVVDVAPPLRLLMIVLDALAERLAARLQGEREHGGVAARRGAAGAALEPVRHHDARSHRLVEMDVAVDAAGEHQEARRVDLGGAARQVVGQGDDAAVLDPDVASADVGRRDDGSAANDEIKVHRCLSAAERGRRFVQIGSVANRMLQSCARAGLTYGLSS